MAQTNMESYNRNDNNPHLQLTPAPPSYGYGGYNRPGVSRPMNSICDVLNRCSKRFEDATRTAEIYADNVWHHFKVSPSLTDAAMARISQGTKLLTEGGHEKIFNQKFGASQGEKLTKSYICYQSTSSGPVIGTLYISTKRIAFCSDYPFLYSSGNGQQQWMYYKVVVQLDQLRAVNPSSNRMNPSEKYIQVVTNDGNEFWFMGFISYDKAVKQLSESLRRGHEHISVNVSAV